MKYVDQGLALAVLSAFSCAAAATTGSLNDFRPKVLPVLVKVDARGNVTSASPATELSPKLNRLLRANLDEMINSPAVDERGRAKASQFILNLAMQASRRPDGDYDVGFEYVSTAPVPSGSWYWVQVDGQRPALASQASTNRSDRFRRDARPNLSSGQDRAAMPSDGGRSATTSSSQSSREAHPR